MITAEHVVTATYRIKDFGELHNSSDDDYEEAWEALREALGATPEAFTTYKEWLMNWWPDAAAIELVNIGFVTGLMAAAEASAESEIARG